MLSLVFIFTISFYFKNFFLLVKLFTQIISNLYPAVLLESLPLYFSKSFCRSFLSWTARVLSPHRYWTSFPYNHRVVSESSTSSWTTLCCTLNQLRERWGGSCCKDFEVITVIIGENSIKFQLLIHLTHTL